MRINREDLFECAVSFLVAAGEALEGAQIVADNLCKADARGVTTHGTYLLTPIHKRLKADLLALPTTLTVPIDHAAVAVVDGGNGLGSIAGKYASDLAVQRVKHFGIGMVLIRNTNHLDRWLITQR